MRLSHLPVIRALRFAQRWRNGPLEGSFRSGKIAGKLCQIGGYVPLAGERSLAAGG